MSQQLKYDTLIYVEERCEDDALTFSGEFIPENYIKRFKSITNCSAIYISIPSTYNGRLNNHPQSRIRSNCDDIPFWKVLFEISESDFIIKILADTPFLDFGIIDEMIQLHSEYLSEYTYSENLPEGISCEIVSRELIKSIPDVHEQTLQLTKIIKSNMNQFDIEIFYKEPDIRDKRISFRTSIPRDKRIMENLYNIHGRTPSYSEIKSLVDTHPEVLFVAPSYIEIELTGTCDLNCIFCYRNLINPIHSEMDPETLYKILSDMDGFSLPYTICLGGSGEPMMHPSFYDFMTKLMERPLIRNIVVETNGLYADSRYKSLLEKDNEKKIKTIVNICGHNEKSYQAIHGVQAFQKVYHHLAELNTIDDRTDSLFIQIPKINETEPELDRYYDFWEKQKIQIILQKQNTYLGKIQDRRYSDLSPLERIPCWHLQRDMYILSNGTVTFCKQDFDGSHARGDVRTNSLQEIFFKCREDFIRDYHKKYPSVPDCKSCDEWYTFNY